MEEEVEEMMAATLAALDAVDGPGWEIVKVGGAQRGQPGHDTDFVLTHCEPGRCAGVRGSQGALGDQRLEP